MSQIAKAVRRSKHSVFKCLKSKNISEKTVGRVVKKLKLRHVCCNDIVYAGQDQKRSVEGMLSTLQLKDRLILLVYWEKLCLALGKEGKFKYLKAY